MIVVEELISVRLELLNVLDPLSEEQLNAKSEENTWSIVQVVRHLLYIDELVYPGVLRAMSRESRPVPEKNYDFVLDRTKRLKSPYPEPSSEFLSKEELLDNLRNSRTPLVSYLKEEVKENHLKERTMVHPLLGPMQVGQLLDFVALHERRHIEQIKELISLL